MQTRSAERQRYEQRQRRKGIVIATASSLAVLFALAFFIPRTPGWQKVKASFFNGEILVSTFPSLLKAFLLDVAIFLWSLPAIAIIGLLLSLIHI